MPLLPEEITTPRFRRRLGRGYHPEDVVAFLTQVASDYAAALEAIAREATRTPEQISQARRAADAETASARDRAHHAAAAIIGHAEQTAEAITNHAQTVREQALADAHAARDRLEDAQARARRLEAAARQHWDTTRAQIEDRWRDLMAADRRLDDRVRQLERALSTLRSRLALADQLAHIENLMTSIRVETRAGWTPSHNPGPADRADDRRNGGADAS